MSGNVILNISSVSNKNHRYGGADEILDQIRLLTGGGHAHVFLRRPAKGRKALHSVR